MSKPVSLSSGLGEVMAPRTLVTACTIDWEQRVELDPGALHGRSALEGRLQLVPSKAELREPQTCWLVWIAIELDEANQPVRFKGISAGPLLVEVGAKRGYKSVADQVNRMSHAMRGECRLEGMGPEVRQALRERLQGISPDLWDRAGESFQRHFS